MESETPPLTQTDKVLYGARDIGAEISRSERQCYYMLEKGLIKCARKIEGANGKGRIWSAARKPLRREFGLDEAGQ